jgi:hypothetical protein
MQQNTPSVAFLVQFSLNLNNLRLALELVYRFNVAFWRPYSPFPVKRDARLCGPNFGEDNRFI